jgi:hypothetical protein
MKTLVKVANPEESIKRTASNSRKYPNVLKPMATIPASFFLSRKINLVKYKNTLLIEQIPENRSTYHQTKQTQQPLEIKTTE